MIELYKIRCQKNTFSYVIIKNVETMQIQNSILVLAKNNQVLV
jgi:hypothetical protein